MLLVVRVLACGWKEDEDSPVAWNVIWIFSVSPLELRLPPTSTTTTIPYIPSTQKPRRKQQPQNTKNNIPDLTKPIFVSNPYLVDDDLVNPAVESESNIYSSVAPHTLYEAPSRRKSGRKDALLERGEKLNHFFFRHSLPSCKTLTFAFIPLFLLQHPLNLRRA